MKALFCCVSAATLFAAAPATALELDTLLPDSIPGYGTPFGVTDYNRLKRIDDSAGLLVNGIAISPALQIGAGYDSAPNGAAPGSALAQESPSVIIADTEIGLGAYAAGNFQQYPQNARQNVTGATLALGERAVLPQETITAAAAYIASQITGFALTTAAPRQPIAFTLADARAKDAVSAGEFTITPALSVSDFRFAGYGAENRVDTAQSLLTEFAPGGPGRLVLLLRAGQSRYATPLLNADTTEALAGLEEDAAGIYALRLLAGVAHRSSRLAGGLTAPVLEASADWRPDDLDQVRLTAAREIDDPDQVSAAPYTLSEAKLTLAHEYTSNVIFNLSAMAETAAYLHTGLRETLFITDAMVNFHVSAALAVNADYAFDDRQANYLRAAHEHVVTIGVTWTP